MPRALVEASCRCAAPLDLETYMRVHFTKVGDQMHLGLRTYIENAGRYGIAADALRELARRLKVEAS